MTVGTLKRNRLSLEQLKSMDGEPIWVEVIVESCIEDGYALVSAFMFFYCSNVQGLKESVCETDFCSHFKPKQQEE